MRWAQLVQGPRQRLVLPWAGGILGPVAVAAAWTPVRGSLPAVNVALILVALVASVGLGGRREAVVASGVVAALSFDVLDTAPYGTLAISRSEDLLTTVVLALVGVAGGELALRVYRARRTSALGTDGFSRVRDAAALVAEGEDAAVVVGAVAEEICRLLGLRDCRYEAGVPAGIREITRDGVVVGTAARLPGDIEFTPIAPWDHVALPVWANGRRVGIYRLILTPGVPLEPAELIVAVTLADQAGASLAPFEPPPTDEDPGRLHLLK